MKRCPIQIIDEVRGGKKMRWIALLKDIDFENKKYDNIIHFHPDEGVETYNKLWIAKLFRGHDAAPIDPITDTIRNPTFSEMKLLEEILIRTESKINLRKQELVVCGLDHWK